MVDVLRPRENILTYKCPPIAIFLPTLFNVDLLDLEGKLVLLNAHAFYVLYALAGKIGDETPEAVDAALGELRQVARAQVVCVRHGDAIFLGRWFNLSVALPSA